MEIKAVEEPKIRIRALGELGNVVIDQKRPITHYYRSGLELIRMANVYLTEGNLEYAYILFLRFITLFVEEIRKHCNYNNWSTVEKSVIKKHLKTVISQTESLKVQIAERYEKEYHDYLENKDKIVDARPKSKERMSDDSALANYSVSVSPYSISNNLRPIIIPQTLIARFMELAEPNTNSNIETCGLLTGILQRDSFVIKLLLIPQQSGTSDDCSSENDFATFDIIDSNNLLTLGWIHTHPSQNAFLSSIDMHSQFGYQSMLAEAVAIVCAPRYSNEVFKLTDYGLDVIRNCTLSGFHPHNSSPPLFQEARHVQFVDIPLQVVDLR